MAARGFTLVELVIVIVVLGILASVAIPKFYDMSADNKQSSCKMSLGGVRSALANYYAYSATPSGGGTAGWPTLTQLETQGTVLEGSLPDNPFSTSTPGNDVVAGTTKGTPVTSGVTGAWAYKAANGDFWADTASGAGEASW